ncbi:UDP-N-acetyl-D-mannosaminuronate dehydrogenase, partial [Anoxybacillus calidus]
YYDPYFPNIYINGINYKSVELSREQIQQADVIVILTDHSVIDWKLVHEEAKVIVDTRGILHSFRKKERT